jgi:hypothetical protein
MVLREKIIKIHCFGFFTLLVINGIHSFILGMPTWKQSIFHRYWRHTLHNELWGGQTQAMNEEKEGDLPRLVAAPKRAGTPLKYVAVIGLAISPSLNCFT